MTRFLLLAAAISVLSAAVLAVASAPESSGGSLEPSAATRQPSSAHATGYASRPASRPSAERLYPVLPTVAELAPPAVPQTDSGLGIYPALAAPQRLLVPSDAAVDAARRWARRRPGVVSFAVADARGGVRGLAPRRPYPSASLTKAMLLVARLRALAAADERLSDAERTTLGYMIRLSDNASASQVFASLGDRPLEALARRAGMRDFAISGDWANATLTAADQARFFLALDRLLPGRFRAFARDQLATVSVAHSWGIPRAARPRWRVFFKGGWRPQEDDELVNQAARLEQGSRHLAIAVLTRGSPLMADGEETIEGVTARLLRPAPPASTPSPLTASDLSSPERLRPLEVFATR